ncbi:putative PB1-F2 protein [Influenza A virus (A/swine/USA/1976/1931(H1N1))]|uniref:Putative PB1-F2 protein n=5 Tax=Influenza A virus TaxID=11320 RepID=A0A7L9RVF8_9INFA|nr:putative PB1-F2 protein [Influenza A virus (A/swine/Jamesburg/1942(H1N1))]ACV52110.1 putative PB1-F2 protein [Influenza A virus (A/swine/USA/1976/1931(H1N1))]ACV52121.1 putative PB1-F2 protein [Influenza A virus (A/swine/USA/1976-MA/1931(H1N1))]AHB59338.1 putative PB1-F2 protein [Influenza A virus (A/swine/London/Scholtissek lab(H1N1))]QOL20539.1 putative PB1-F2 protein [Influenza A virus]
MDHCQKIMNRVVMPKQIVYWKQWLSLRSPTPVSLKTHALKRWKLFSKHEWTS